MARPAAALLVTTLLLLAAVSADAASGRISAKGVRLGLAHAAMTGPGADPGLTPSTGLTAGAFVTVPLGGALALQPEILYTQKGGEIEGGANPYEYGLSYVEVPVLCMLTVASQREAFRPRVYGGPQVALKVSAQRETYSDRYGEESVEEGLAGAREIDAGFVVGVGADQVLGPGRVLVDVRYGRSLLSAFTTGPEVRHSVISVLLGYSFD